MKRLGQIPIVGLCVCVLSVLCLAGATPVWAYSFLRKPENNRAMQWKRNKFPINIVQEKSLTKDVSQQQLEEIIKLSIGAWNGIQCAPVPLMKYGGITQTIDAPSADGNNVIKFVTNPAQWAWAANQFAVTVVTSFVRTGEITDADMMMNNWNFKFGTSGQAQEADLQATITHELGHVLGLGHSAVPNSSMYFAANVGETGKRKLQDDDTRAVCDLYPIQPCQEGQENTQNKTVCFNGRVAPVCAPYSQACMPCQIDTDCFGDKNFCINGACGHECGPAKPCESGYTCRAVQLNNQIVGQNCVPDANCQVASRYPCCRNNDDCLPTYNCIQGECVRDKICRNLAENCTQTDTCCTGLTCVNDGTGARCRKPCDPLSPRCDRGTRCALEGTTGAGFCVPPNGGGGEDAVCDDQTKKCEYELFCDPKEKRCRYLCRPGAQGSCPPNFSCQALEGTQYGLCYKGSRGCTTSGDCPTGQVCKNKLCSPCTADSDCPARNRCIEGACRSACTSDPECPRQHRCDKGICTPGVPCVQDSDCTGGLICRGNVCSQTLTGSCNSDSDCSAGQVCEQGSCQLPDSCSNKCNADERCLKGQCVPLTCQTDGQCGQGYKCRNSQCIEATTDCGGTGPCPTGTECIQGKCVNALGSPCVGDEDCVPGLTCVAGGAAGKRCTKICSGATDCPNGFFCVTLSGIGAGCWRAGDSVCDNNGQCKPKTEGCGGCAATNNQPTDLGGLMLLLLLLAGLRLRKRKTRP